MQVTMILSILKLSLCSTLDQLNIKQRNYKTTGKGKAVFTPPHILGVNLCIVNQPQVILL